MNDRRSRKHGEESGWSITEGGKCGGLGAVSDLVVLKRLCLSRRLLEVWDQSQERDQGQRDKSGSHYVEVKAVGVLKCGGDRTKQRAEQIKASGGSWKTGVGWS